MAEYYITHVRYHDDGSKIQKVKTRRSLYSSHISEKKKPTVVRDIDRLNKTVYTAIKSGGRYRSGAKVHVVVSNGEKWIRTDRNRRAADNLGELPEF